MTSVLYQIWNSKRGLKADSNTVSISQIRGNYKGDERAFLEANRNVFKVGQIELTITWTRKVWRLFNSSRGWMAAGIIIVVCVILGVLLCIAMFATLMKEWQYFSTFVVMGLFLFVCGGGGLYLSLTM